MRILLVEDSERLQRSIATGLRRAGYAVDTAGDGLQGWRCARGNAYDAIVLDLMLPGLDGLTLLQRLRDASDQTHVLILTAKDTLDDRVRGLQIGADDYLTKPFAFEELLARIQALVRRAYGVKNPAIVIGDLSIDTVKRLVSRAGCAIDLTPRDYALLEYLALRHGQLVSRSEIEAHIYDEQVEPFSNVVDAAVYALRKKIDVPGQPSLIRTRRGMGYVLEPPNAEAGP
ncbi:MAG TPA: response regulator transcription factor [Tepidisphaeraceae bacterium]|jgi:DNA-binding response OmpR family regulator|nr:response regulator transcription factor [Tepidisphaeraceae bacterium]